MRMLWILSPPPATLMLKGGNPGARINQLFEQERYDEADSRFVRAIQIGRTCMPGSPRLATFLNNRARLLVAQVFVIKLRVPSGKVKVVT